MPNGPVGHPTSQFYAAGGVPEVMLNLKKLGLLNLDELTVSGKTMRENLEWWEESERRKYVREFLSDNDKINPENVIMSKSNATLKGLTSTVTFPVGNIAPEGSVIKSTASFEQASPQVQPGDDFLPGKCSGFRSTERIFKF